MVAPVVSLLPEAQQQFLDQNGAPLAAGLVYHYVPGTTTPASTWADPALSVLNPNPVQLDMGGRATIWGNTQYRQIVVDVLGNQIYDLVTGVPNVPLGNGSLTSAGWWQLAGGGPVIQWQQLAVTVNSLTTENFPVPFPNGAFLSVGNLTSSFFIPSNYTVGLSPLSKSQFTIYVEASAGSGTVNVNIIHLGS